MAKPPKKPRSLSPIGPYEVGYCKPPKAHQFQKGMPSANPKGRPKGSPNQAKANPLPFVDIPIHKMVLEEANRLVQVREGDKVVMRPAMQAGVRASLIRAGQGSAPAMRNMHLITRDAHLQERREMEERIKAALEYKKTAKEHLASCKRRGVRFDWEVHPDDINIDLETGQVLLAGPVTMEERAGHKMVLDTLDHSISTAREIATQIRNNPKLRNERKLLGLAVYSIDRFNAMLAPHWQKLCDPEIRELAIMPEIDGEEEDEVEDEVDGSSEDQDEDSAPL
jgi:hypothetical protein